MPLLLSLLKRYLLARLAEASTWRGLALAGSSLGIVLDPSQMEAFVALGLGISGLIGAFFPDA